MKINEFNSPYTEASYEGNIGAMEMFKFYQVASDKQKAVLKNLIAKGKKGLAWKLIQQVTGVKLQGKEFDESKKLHQNTSLDIKFKIDADEYEVVITSFDDQGNQLGYATFDRAEYGPDQPIKNLIIPTDLKVNKIHRGQGIASRMYDHLTDAGYTIRRSSDQTAAGSKFWNTRQGKDSKYWEDNNSQQNEGWKDWAMAAGIGSMAAGIGGAAYDAYKGADTEKPTQVQAGKVKAPEIKAPIAKAIKSVTDSPHERLLAREAVKAGIEGEELAQFLAQTAHESHNFKTMVEYGNTDYFKQYEPKFLKDKKTKKIIVDPKTKKPKNFNPKAATLGNVKPGDGERYKGRGYIQLTGRYNYSKAGQALGLPLEENPELVEKPEIAAKIAIWFWQTRVKPKVDDFSDTKAATKPINPGLKHLDRRKEKFQDYKVALK